MCRTTYELLEILTTKGLLETGKNTPAFWRIPDEWTAWLVEAQNIRDQILSLNFSLTEI